jgi:replicative DNA helicase
MSAPKAIQAERALLGGLLLDPAQVAEVAATLKPADFYVASHGHVFAWLAEQARTNSHTDVISLHDYMVGSKQAERMGGIAYATGLPEHCPSTSNLSHYAKQVKEASTRRRLRQVSSELAEACTGERPTADLLAEAEAAIYGLSASQDRRDWQSIGDVLSTEVVELQDACDNPGETGGLMTGLTAWDDQLLGMRPGDLVVLAARPGMGKTALALNIAQRVALQGVGVGFLSLEMGAGQLAMRTLGSVAEVDGRHIRTATVSHADFAKLEDAHNVLHDAPIWIEDTPGLTIGQIRSKARRLKAMHPEVGLIVVDYIQLMEGDPSTKGNREQAVSSCSRGLKHLGKELGLPVIALAQLNRGVEQRADKRPMLSDLRESGAIEQDADAVVFLYRDEYYNPDTTTEPGVAEFIAAKVRAGKTGTLKAGWDGRYFLFKNLDQGLQ